MCTVLSKPQQFHNDKGVSGRIEAPKEQKRLSVFLRIWHEFVNAPERRRLFVAIVALILSSGANLTFPAIIGKGIDFTTRPEAAPPIHVMLATALSIFSVGAFASWLRVYSFKLTSHRVEQRMRKKLFHALMLQVGYRHHIINELINFPHFIQNVLPP